MGQAVGIILFALLVGGAIKGLTALFQSKSEVARRAKIALLCLLALAVGTVWFMAAGPVGFAIAVAALGVLVWIFRGRKG